MGKYLERFLRGFAWETKWILDLLEKQNEFWIILSSNGSWGSSRKVGNKKKIALVSKNEVWIIVLIIWMLKSMDIYIYPNHPKQALF